MSALTLPVTEPDDAPVTGPPVAEQPVTEPPATEHTVADRLVVAAVGGDRRAVEELLGLVHPFVLRYCKARIGGPEAADVAQEACLALARAQPGHRPGRVPFFAFVYRIAANKVVDAYRASGRRRCVPVAEVPDGPDPGDGPEHRVLALEESGELGELLDLLTARQREILVLRIAVGLSARETADAIGSTPEAVRVAQHRALTRLRAAALASR